MAGLLWYIMAGLLWSGNFGEQLLSAEAGSTECVLPLSEAFCRRKRPFNLRGIPLTLDG